MSRKLSRPRSLVATVVASILVAAAAGPASAGRGRDSYPANGENLFLVSSYFVEPVGTLLEWTVTRPLAALDAAISPKNEMGMGGFHGCSRERPARSCTDIVK